MTFLATYIMRGRMQAMMIASFLALLSLLMPPVSIVSSASVALVTLRRGGVEGLYVLISACFSASLLGFILLGNYQFALLYSLVLWLPVWVISIVLREGQHLSVAVEIAVLVGILAVISCYILVNDPAFLLNALLNEMIQPMLNSNANMPLDEVKQSIQLASHYMVGGIAAGTVCGLLFSLFLARCWQSALYNPGGFRKEYLSLGVHSKMAFFSIVVVAVAWLMSGIISEVGWNIMILFAVLYAFVGTSILHSAFSRVKMKRFMVPFLYITLILVPHMLAVVIIIGAADVWLGIRNKISNKIST